MASPSDGPPPSDSWTRKDRPCDACRRRKIRCLSSENLKRCVLCQSHSKDCTYENPPPKKRRLNSQDESQDVSNARPRAKLVAASQGTLPLSDYSAFQGPSLLKKTLGHQNRQSSSYLGITEDYDPWLINLSPFDDKGEYHGAAGTLRRANHNTHFMMVADSQPEMDEELANLDAIEAVVAPYGKALVDLYFRIVHPSFPILHKKVFLEKHGRTYRELTPLGLAAVYILALNWWSYSLDLSELPKPDVKKLEKMIPKMMSEVYNRPKISDLQGGLVLLQRPEGDSWTMTANLVAMAQNLGIHLDCTDWRIPDWERGVRKRVAWALYMQDKWGSLVHGRPSLIVPDNWIVKPLETQDFPETAKDDDDEDGSSEVEKGKSIFLHLLILTEILAEILVTFFTLRATLSNASTIEVLEKAKPLQIRLKTWYSSLPAELSMDETKARKLSSTGYLHLAYFTTEITLHRAILRSTNSSPQLTSIIRTAAKARFTSAMAFIQRLRPEHLQSFWYFASKINLAIIGTFGAVLWATSDNAAEGDFYKAKLAEYRWQLRVNSTSAPFMKWAVGRVDASTTFLSDTTKKSTVTTEKVKGDDAATDTEPLTYDHSPSSQYQGLPTDSDPDLGYTPGGSYEMQNLGWNDLGVSPNGAFSANGVPIAEGWMYDFETMPDHNPGFPTSGILDNTLYDTSTTDMLEFWRSYT